MNTDLERLTVIAVGLSALLLVGSIIRPAGQAQQAKQEQTANLKKQAAGAELQHVMNSPAFRKQIAEMTLGRQFPGECGRGVHIVSERNGSMIARCDYSDSQFEVGPLSNGSWIAMRCGARCQ